MIRSDTEIFFDCEKWAEEQFGGCELGDARRTRRVVKYAAMQAFNPSGSTNEVCSGDEAAAEGAYRLLRNRAVRPQAISEGPFKTTAKACEERDVVLAIQDTTGLSIHTALSESLGKIGRNDKCGRGYLVHSTLAVDGHTAAPIGLLDQELWQRQSDRQSKDTRRYRRYKDKESFKWESASRRIRNRVETMSNIVTVCDREADIREFLQHHVTLKERFVVRAAHNRCITAEKELLFPYMKKQPVMATYQVAIGQRGGQKCSSTQKKRPPRQNRTADMEVRSATIEVGARAKDGKSKTPFTLNVVLATETGVPDGETPLEWMLLTSEPVAVESDALAVVRYYELRWLIEEFHKVWKTGCRIEQRALQAPENFERLVAITVHIAVRLLQLRAATNSDPDRSCNEFLDQDQWQCLWASCNPDLSPPDKPLSLGWALREIARLAGWRDSKRTGRIGWSTLWKGWARLEERVIGWKIARNTM